MNEHLVERFGRGRAYRQRDEPQTITRRPIMTTNPSIREYFKASKKPVESGHWTGLREIPSSSELFSRDRSDHEESVELSENIVVGPFASKEDYLDRQYSLLREDAIAPLRNVISELQNTPYIMEKESDNNAYIYEKAFITGLTFANAGIAARLTFSLRRVGKRVNWEQSKRLLTGAIVALTPAREPFKSICHIAVIAARPLAGLQQNPPEIDVFFGAPDELEIDPQQEWLMVESRNGFFEGHRHTLRELQVLAHESFPLSEHIVDIKRDVEPPEYVSKQAIKDLSKLFPAGERDVRDVNILNDWPSDLASELDASQMDALRRMLAKRLAIVQGPPGTGKTHVSVIAVELLLQNMAPEDPPIIIAAHTNHALDQLLRHISKFEPEFIRLGGWTKDMEIIKPRTLYEVKDSIKNSIPQGSMRGPAIAKLKQLALQATRVLKPLTEGDQPLTALLFNKYGVISDAQLGSIEQGAKEWVRAGAEDIPGAIAMWLGDERIEAKQRTLPEDFGFEIEEVDLEFEQLKEMEAESKLVDEEDRDSLRGPRLVFMEPWTGRKSIGVTDKTVIAEMQKPDLWDIPSEYRGPVYRYMSQRLKEAIRAKVREIARLHTVASQDAKIGLWELDYNYLKSARVVGMTTTGLSKYRGLLSSLKSKVVLIEEASETLESALSVACFKSLQHLILVGDHQQLRGHCNDEDLANAPFYLSVSMFERLVRNKVEFSQMKRQRRMHPEIRRALKPIYEELDDHPSVSKRPLIPGMGGMSSYFFSHKWREAADAQMSKINHEEADMVVAFFRYLVQNGTAPRDITVLTFYNGQRKLLLRKLFDQRLIYGSEYFNVVTVDSYQGEENAIVLLSLVRSNPQGNIGFCSIENRVCVALSRAQRGFYIFGDAPNLAKSSMLWFYVIRAMAENPCRVGFYMHLTCEKHQEKTFIKEPSEFACLDGGCVRPCREELPCGHLCILSCHSFSHEVVDCGELCSRVLDCGHSCIEKCHAECKSNCDCEPLPEDIPEPVSYAKAAAGYPKEDNQLPSPSTSGAWTPSTQKRQHPQKLPVREAPPQKTKIVESSAYNPVIQNVSSELSQGYRKFAAGGHIESDRMFAAMAETENAEARQKRLDKLDEENAAALFGGTEEEVAAEKKKNNNMKLVRTMEDGKGGSRGIWKGTMKVPQKEKGVKKQERSLLD